MSYGTPDLNFVESDIDLTTVKPIGVGEIVRLVNEYLLRMTDILNAFAVRTEGGIVQLDRRLDSVESQIILLEKKLENVKLTESIQSGPIMPHHITQLHQDAPQELASTSAENITDS
ncbi:subunit CCDC53 of WASH complex domain-containing protein [Ditylenchus destructor]|nr:subunit CCDC53 of WASH complex domain-containing protein [Ditylenchus destructor]